MRFRFPRSPLRYGRWLSWLMHDIGQPDEDMPSRRRLRYGIRHASSTQADHHYSEPRPGMTPCVEVWLYRIDALTWTGQAVTLWRTEAVIQLYAGVHRVNLAEDRSFTHEHTARKHFGDLCTMRSHICDPPAEDWVNPAPWRHALPVPVGTATAWCQDGDGDDVSDLFWLNALGVEVMVRWRDDGTYVHLDTAALDHRRAPLLVEVNNSGATAYHLDGSEHDDPPEPVDIARQRSYVDVTALARLLAAQGIATAIFAAGGAHFLRIGNIRDHDELDDFAELAAGPAFWDERTNRFLGDRVHFGVGPDTGTQPSDPNQFWSPPADAGETVIAARIAVMLAQTRAAATPAQHPGAGR